MMKSKLVRSISLWLVIMIGSLFIVDQPLLAVAKEKQMITLEDVMGSAAKLIVNEDEYWVRVAYTSPYSMALKDIPGTLFSEQGELYIYVAAELDEREGTEGITFDNSKSKIVAKQNDKELQARCKLEKDGKLLIKVSDIDRQEGVNITLQDLQIVLDRTVPEGRYHLEVSSPDGKNQSKLLFKESVIVQSASCGIIPFVTFYLDKKEYVTNVEKHQRNTTYEIEVFAYKNTEGIVMVPMKYAFNDEIKDIIFSNDVMWFTYDMKRIKLNMHTKVAVTWWNKNGNTVLERIPLVAKPEVKNGRVYLAAEDVAKINGHGWSVWQDPKEPNVITISGMC